MCQSWDLNPASPAAAFNHLYTLPVSLGVGMRKMESHERRHLQAGKPTAVLAIFVTGFPKLGGSINMY